MESKHVALGSLLLVLAGARAGAQGCTSKGPLEPLGVGTPAATGGVAFSRAMRARFGSPAAGALYPGRRLPAGLPPQSAATGDGDVLDGVRVLANQLLE